MFMYLSIETASETKCYGKMSSNDVVCSFKCSYITLTEFIS